ncbi:hypothetical protein [Stenotrophomonas sp. SORGH_AS_0321]|uniref:hypothetical protein n=1 Tax=Stenotrophomonas sp. SORGH_AS_0321 TaxID=3041787 RepID=UPI00286BDAFB|nr:hypothetical protein [Stenotrophomonas sp. SORGH_AS_0321]
MVAATTALAHAPVPPPYLAGDAPAPHDEVQAAVHQASVLEGDGAVASLEDALLQIARECRDDRSCRARAINELLQHVPSSTLAQLQQIVARTAVPAQEGRQNAWPLPGTAAVPFSAVSQLHELASTLADLYTPAVAAFQDDMETIVGRHAARTRWPRWKPRPDPAALDRCQCLPTAGHCRIAGA